MKKCYEQINKYTTIDDSVFEFHKKKYNLILQHMQSGKLFEDSTYAWKIIKIVNPVILGQRHWREAQEMLEDIGAAYKMTDAIKNQGYYKNRNINKLLQSKKFCEDNNLKELLEKINEEISKRKM